MGLKSSSADEAARLNVAAFYYDYQDLQVLIRRDLTDPAKIINAGEASNKGVDAELGLRLPGGFDLGGTVSYLDAEYRSLSAVDPLSNQLRDYSGVPLPLSPKWSTGLRLAKLWQMNDGASATVSLQWRYQSKVLYDFAYEDFLYQGGYGLFNATASYAFDSGRYVVSLYGRNLTNEDAIETAIFNSGLTGGTTTFIAPRTYGARLSVQF